jgi:hypothetical protein
MHGQAPTAVGSLVPALNVDADDEEPHDQKRLRQGIGGQVGGVERLRERR